MDDQIRKTVHELLQFRRTEYTATRAFQKLKHNADLCPRFQKQLETILGAFEKYRKIVYDIQGPRDRGADVVLRQSLNEEAFFINLQIKSDSDLREKDYLKTLKSQYFDSKDSFQRLVDYYVILCTDLTGKKGKTERVAPPDQRKKDIVRTVEAEFRNKQDVHVIEPEYALTFLRLSSMQIDATIKSKLGADDIVLAKAQEIVRRLSASERAILFHLIWLKIYQSIDSVNRSGLKPSSAVYAIYSTSLKDDQDSDFDGSDFDDSDSDDSDFDGSDSDDIEYSNTRDKYSSVDDTDITQRMMADLIYLEDNLVYGDKSGNYSLALSEVLPLVELMIDGQVRYGYEESELIYYMMDLFGPIEGYEPQQGEL